MAHKEKPATATKDASKQKFVRRAIESASEYNLFLNRQRRLERSVYMDQQTETVNYPVGLGRQNKTLTSTDKVGRFPVAVMPSQYQDWYIEYSPEELEFLPVGTILRGPIMSIDKLPPVLTTPNVSDFETDSDSDSSASSSSSCSSSDDCSSCCSCCAGESANNGSINATQSQGGDSAENVAKPQQADATSAPPTNSYHLRNSTINDSST